MNADFRRLKFTHNGTHVLDEVTDTRKLQCEVFLETVARAPGCPQKPFIVKFGSEPLSQEGNTMFGPGVYRPDPSAGITAPEDLPQPEIVPYSRNDIRQLCPRDLLVTYSQHYCTQCRKYFSAD